MSVPGLVLVILVVVAIAVAVAGGLGLLPLGAIDASAPTGLGTTSMTLTREQLDALVLGLPWQRLGEAGVIRLV